MNSFKTIVISSKENISRREWMKSIQPKIGLDFDFFDLVEINEITTDVRKHFDKSNFNTDEIITRFMTHTKILMESVLFGDDVLILEDNIDIIRKVDWSDIDFKQFDVLNISDNEGSSFAYFVSFDGAHKILSILDDENLQISEEWDKELYKMGDRIDYVHVVEPVFTKKSE